MTLSWEDSLSDAKRGVRPIYARIDQSTYYDITSVMEAVEGAFQEASRSLVRGPLHIKIDIEREVTLAEVVAVLSGVKKSVKIISDLKFMRESTTKEVIDAGLPLIIAVEEVVERLSRSYDGVSEAQVMDVIARLVVAEEGVQVKQLARKSAVKLLKGEETEHEFEDVVARYNILLAKESLSPEENKEATVLKERLDIFPDVDRNSKLRLMIDDATWKRLLFGGKRE